MRWRKSSRNSKSCITNERSTSLTLERLTTLGNNINKTAENYNQVVTSFVNGSNSSMVGKFIQLSNYKRELDKNQPILSESITRSLPYVEFYKI
jgi:DNA anti-recombination protein RmuC